MSCIGQSLYHETVRRLEEPVLRAGNPARRREGGEKGEEAVEGGEGEAVEGWQVSQGRGHHQVPLHHAGESRWAL